MTCRHAISKRRDGPKIPARWGSWGIEVCGTCWMWRPLRPMGACGRGPPFRPATELVEQLCPEEDDRG